MIFEPSNAEKAGTVLMLSAALFLLVVGAVAITSDLLDKKRCDCPPTPKLPAREQGALL